MSHQTPTMQTLWVVLLLAVCVCLSMNQADKWKRKKRRANCVTQPRLRDKWQLLDSGRRESLRVRSHQMVHRRAGEVSKYRCLENTGNIYMLRKKNISESHDGVLCLGFSYIADHPRAEYVVLRLIGPGNGTHLMSPVPVLKKSKISIEDTCDLEGESFIGDNRHVTNSYIRRALPGCKFPKQIRGRWNYTYQHARSVELWKRNSTLHLMDGSHVKFACDKREGSLFVLRANKYPDRRHDAIMCVEFLPTEEDQYYSFQVNRHNSGNLLDGQLKTVSRSKSIYIHVDCDWMGSPARPEFLYP